MKETAGNVLAASALLLGSLGSAGIIGVVRQEPVRAEVFAAFLPGDEPEAEAEGGLVEPVDPTDPNSPAQTSYHQQHPMRGPSKMGQQYHMRQ